jgi:restriction endonuclease Mrr
LFVEPTEEAAASCSELLLQERAFRNMEPIAFERFVQTVLRHYFDCEVQHVGKSHDGGIDLLMVTRDEGLVPVQIKRRAYDGAVEGVAVIREFLGAMVTEGYRSGVFVSSAPTFSRRAHNSSISNAKSAMTYRIRLLDSRTLIRMCGLLDVDGQPMRFVSSNGAYDTAQHFARCQRLVDDFNRERLAEFARRTVSTL